MQRKRAEYEIRYGVRVVHTGIWYTFYNNPDMTAFCILRHYGYYGNKYKVIFRNITECEENYSPTIPEGDLMLLEECFKNNFEFYESVLNYVKDNINIIKK